MIEIDQTNALRERETNNVHVFDHLPLTLKKYCTSHALKCYIEKRNIQGSLYAFLRLFDLTEGVKQRSRAFIIHARKVCT